ncbi:hypothetical protein JKY79_00610 [Candidatus Babeliales bacterium]|nr:hypothetical protein [Candidatus Babeliales bacterium]
MLGSFQRLFFYGGLKKKKTTIAIMISASHNSYFDNGIKVFDVATGKINEHDEHQITELYNATYSCLDDVIFKRSYRHTFPLCNDWKDFYKKWIQKIIPYNTLCESKIVIDAANGAMSEMAVDVFRLFVSDVVVINAKPNGKNINAGCGAMYPEKLAEIVIKEKALLGFAFDGDGDRVIAVDYHGHIRDGDEMLYLLLQHPDFYNQKIIVGTIMSNVGFEQALQSEGKQLVRTPVGDKHVAHAMKKHASLIGGEASGHIILKPYISTGDGLFVAIKVFETIINKYANFDDSFTRFIQINKSLPISSRIPIEELNCYQELQALHQEITPGRMIVRYSGTEEIIRITTEHEDEAIAEAINKQIVSLLANAY